MKAAKYLTTAQPPASGSALQRGQMWTAAITDVVFLRRRPFQVSQGVTRAEGAIPAHVVIVAEAPCPAKLGKH